MNFSKIYDDFKIKLKESIPFIRVKPGNYLFIGFIAVVILTFFAPLFPANVGTALTSCVFAPYLVLIWRKNDKEHAIVPAVLLSCAMFLAAIIYLIAGKANVTAYYLISIVCLYLCATAKFLEFFDRIDDNMKLYLTAGAICFSIVIVASIIALLVSIAWWIICLIAFLLLLGFFIAVVLGTTAYTATDDTRQERIKREGRKKRETLFRENRTYNRPVQKVRYDDEVIDADFED